MSTFSISPRGPYALERSSEFLCGFKPASGASTASNGTLTIAFLDDESFQPVAVKVSTGANGDLVGEAQGAAANLVAPQVARILSLDYDASPMLQIAQDDPVIGRLVDAHPGFRPICFASPYEAAVWGVLAQRTPMATAAKLKVRLAAELGGTIEAFGETRSASPPPRQLLDLRKAPGISDEKLARLHDVARAALDGKLAITRLRTREHEASLSELRSIRGVGEWTASHILLRGAGVADAVPLLEPRFLRGVAEAYGLEGTPTVEEVERIADAWRPLRMWISVLVVMHMARVGAGWHGPEPRGKTRRRAPRASAQSSLFARSNASVR